MTDEQIFEDEPIEGNDGQHTPAGGGPVRAPRRWRAVIWIAVLAVVLVVGVGIIQNQEQVRVEFLAWGGSIPLWVVMIASALVGALLALLLRARSRRRRSRHSA